MPALADNYRQLIEKKLINEFVPLLPPLIDQTKPGNEQLVKNVSRAFSAFVLSKVCNITPQNAGAAIVDDFDDKGIDGLYYDVMSETLYCIQSKFKAREQFGQDEAFKFCEGVRKLLAIELDNFNRHVTDRRVDIENALENCSRIQLVVAHIGSGISQHALDAIENLIRDESEDDPRLADAIIEYDAHNVVVDLLKDRSYGSISATIDVKLSSHVTTPRLTFFGLIPLIDLINLHNRYGVAFYEKNIRTFLGIKSTVNAAIQRTLATAPQDFLFQNNGVTALATKILPKNNVRGSHKKMKRLKLEGLSIINGAQTIATAALFRQQNPAVDISSALVSITVIEASSTDTFGKAVTMARNHQNPVSFSNFVALDDEQERLRRELTYLNFNYVYKAGTLDARIDPSRIHIEEAAQALALFQKDPRFAIWLKREPMSLLNVSNPEYRQLFSPQLTAQYLINAVLFYRYVLDRITNYVNSSSGQEKLTYKHGAYVYGWILAQRLKNTLQAQQIIDEVKLRNQLSQPADDLRQSLWNRTQVLIQLKGPLALFRNQTDVIPLMDATSIEHFGLAGDQVVGHKRQVPSTGNYPEPLFDYLISKAPQITNLV